MNKDIEFYQNLKCKNWDLLPMMFTWDRENHCERFTLKAQYKNNLKDSYVCTIAVYKNGDFKFHFYNVDNGEPWIFEKFYEEYLTVGQKEIQGQFLQIANMLLDNGVLQ